MIYPNMATMLAFLTCDAGIQKEEWDKMIAIAAKNLLTQYQLMERQAQMILLLG